VRLPVRRGRVAGRGARLRRGVHAGVLRLRPRPPACLPRPPRRQLARSREGEAARARGRLRPPAGGQGAGARADGVDGLLGQVAPGILSAAASAARWTTLSGTPFARARARQSSYSGATFAVPSGARATLTRTLP